MDSGVSVIIPVFNERENLDALVERLLPVLERVADGNFEVLFVNDGSQDGSGEMLDALSERDRRCKAIHFSRNFGHQSALQAGLDAASGSAVVLMDADLQDPPELLASFVEKWKQGYEVVYAIRRKRAGPWLKRVAYRLFYRSLKWLSDIDTPLDAGDFCLLDQKVVRALVGLHERTRFLRGLRSWVGFNQVGIEYDRAARSAGEPKYTLHKLIHLALSGYIGFSSTPLRLAVWLGLSSAAFGFLVTFWVIASRFTNADIPHGWASTIAVIFFVGGAQLIMLGILGEYLARVYDEVRRRPLYVVRSRTGFSHSGLAQSLEKGL